MRNRLKNELFASLVSDIDIISVLVHIVGSIQATRYVKPSPALLQ